MVTKFQFLTRLLFMLFEKYKNPKFKVITQMDRIPKTKEMQEQRPNKIYIQGTKKQQLPKHTQVPWHWAPTTQSHCTKALRRKIKSPYIFQALLKSWEKSWNYQTLWTVSTHMILIGLKLQKSTTRQMCRHQPRTLIHIK